MDLTRRVGIDLEMCIRDRVPYLKAQLAEVKGENAELQETARDYDRLCRADGPESVAETVAAVRQQEQAEKEQKRSQKRRHDRDAR